MSAYKSRHELRDALIHRFSSLEEVYQVHLFGKEVDQKQDVYSDIDIIICSKDLAQTQSLLLTTIESISPIRESLWLKSTSTLFAASYMLHAFSPYQKIDLSLTNDIAQTPFEPLLPVYASLKYPPGSSSTLKLIPKPRVSHQLIDLLFSIPRFTKCLFRKDIDMYRRWKGISNKLMVLLYEQHTIWQAESAQKLSADQSNKLYQMLQIDEMKRLGEIFPSNGRLNLLNSFQRSISWLIELSNLKADYYQEKLNKAFTIYMQNFLADELGSYANNTSE